jgi:hypothetical protein
LVGARGTQNGGPLVIALIRHTLSTVLLSQRYLPPVLVFLAALFIFTGQRSITVVNAGGSGRVLAASVWVSGVWCAAIAVVGLLYPLLVGHHPVGPAVLVLGVLAELTSACTGMALGLLCSRLVIRRTGWSILGALAAVLLFVLVPGVPPVHPVFRMLAGTRPPPSILLPVAAFGLVSIVLLAGATLLTGFVAQRRD